MNFKYSSHLDILYSKVAIGIPVLHITEKVVKILDFIDGINKYQHFGFFYQSKISNHERNSLLFSD